MKDRQPSQRNMKNQAPASPRQGTKKDTQAAKRTRTTMDDIARSLHISKNSVSLALSGKNGVSDELRQKIIDKAIEMQYGIIAATQAEKSRCIVLIMPEYLHNDAFFYSDVFWSVERQAQARGCIPINTGITVEMEQSLTLPTLPREVDIVGILCIGVLKNAYVEKLLTLGYPMVSVDIAYHNVPICCVGSSNLSGGYLATNYLIENGHRDIGFIGPINTALSIYERWCGYLRAMRQAGLAVNDAMSVTAAQSSFVLFDTVDVLEQYMSHITRYPTAWFCAGDRIAAALINLMNRRGVRVPDDVSVIGFDDIAIAQIIMPQLTTIRIDRRLMGQLAVDCVLDMSQNAANTANATNTANGIIHHSLSGSLVVRDSVKNLKSINQNR